MKIYQKTIEDYQRVKRIVEDGEKLSLNFKVTDFVKGGVGVSGSSGRGLSRCLYLADIDFDGNSCEITEREFQIKWGPTVDAYARYDLRIVPYIEMMIEKNLFYPVIEVSYCDSYTSIYLDPNSSLWALKRNRDKYELELKKLFDSISKALPFHGIHGDGHRYPHVKKTKKWAYNNLFVDKYSWNFQRK